MGFRLAEFRGRISLVNEIQTAVSRPVLHANYWHGFYAEFVSMTTMTGWHHCNVYNFKIL